MTMTSNGARALGSLIARARAKRGISTRKLATEIGTHATWITKLEAGRYLEPAPTLLARISEALDIPPERIDRITKQAMANGLPQPRTYFRAKYDLNADQAAQVERYIARLRSKA